MRATRADLRRASVAVGERAPTSAAEPEELAGILARAFGRDALLSQARDTGQTRRDVERVISRTAYDPPEEESGRRGEHAAAFLASLPHGPQGAPEPTRWHLDPAPRLRRPVRPVADPLEHLANGGDAADAAGLALALLSGQDTGTSPQKCAPPPLGPAWYGAPPPLDPQTAAERARRASGLWSRDAVARRSLVRELVARAEAEARSPFPGLPGPDVPRAVTALRTCERGGWGVDAATGHIVLSREAAAPMRQALHCDHRLCPWCARRRARATRDRLAPAMSALLGDRAPTMLTLTQLGLPGEPLAAAAERFDRAWIRLTRSSTWREHVTWAALGIETTRSTPERRAAARDAHPADCPACRSGEACAEWEGLRRSASRPGSWWHVHAHLVLGSKTCARSVCSCCTYLGGRKADQHPAVATDSACLDLRRRLRALPPRDQRTPEERAAARKIGAELGARRHRLAREAITAELARIVRPRGAVRYRSKTRDSAKARQVGGLLDRWGERSDARPWLDRGELQDDWHRCTAAAAAELVIGSADVATDAWGSCRVERPRGGKKGRKRSPADDAAAEVLKYLTKPLELVPDLDHSERVELVSWMRGRRLLRTYGGLRGITDDPPEERETLLGHLQVYDDEIGHAVEAIGLNELGEPIPPSRLRWSTHPAHAERAAAVLIARARNEEPPPPPSSPPPPTTGQHDDPGPPPIWCQIEIPLQ